MDRLTNSRQNRRQLVQAYASYTEIGNGVTPPRLSGVRRSRRYVASLDVGRIASEANAFGKAEGYADGGTVSGR